MTTQTALRQGLNPRQAETVARLTAAGLDELREVGHEALTIRTVAQRAGVSPATAYTYLASKNHLFAELFWRHIASISEATTFSGTTIQRVQQATGAIVDRIVEEPALAAAVTPALLGTDPDVERLRLKIGIEFVTLFESALATPMTEGALTRRLVDVLTLTLSGALLQAGMGVMSYDAMGAQLADAVAVILAGNTNDGDQE